MICLKTINVKRFDQHAVTSDKYCNGSQKLIVLLQYRRKTDYKSILYHCDQQTEI